MSGPIEAAALALAEALGVEVRVKWLEAGRVRLVFTPAGNPGIEVGVDRLEGPWSGDPPTYVLTGREGVSLEIRTSADRAWAGNNIPSAQRSSPPFGIMADRRRTMSKRQQKHTEDDERRQGPPEAMIQPEDVDAAIGEGGTTASPSHKPKPKLSIRLEEVGLDELADAVVAAEKRHGVSSIVLLRDYALGRTAHDDPDTEDWVDELLLFFSEPRIRRLVCDADESA